MPITNDAEILEVDASAIREAIEGVIEGSLRSLVEFDADRFNPLYVDDVTLSFYEDESQMQEHFSRIHAYVHVDLTEMDLFVEELFPVAEEVEYLVTALDSFTLVRVYLDDGGLFLALDHDEPVKPVVDAIQVAVADR